MNVSMQEHVVTPDYAREAVGSKRLGVWQII
jgi:hypothetical protein